MLDKKHKHGNASLFTISTCTPLYVRLTTAPSPSTCISSLAPAPLIHLSLHHYWQLSYSLQQSQDHAKAHASNVLNASAHRYSSSGSYNTSRHPAQTSLMQSQGPESHLPQCNARRAPNPVLGSVGIRYGHLPHGHAPAGFLDLAFGLSLQIYEDLLSVRYFAINRWQHTPPDPMSPLAQSHI
ncbi:hypothetical protein EV356DRAFT_165233 [Viridothelium virens]|uniref:Uncharacterized protein n=1 Tax=Viridothelium virens TaxID=1048519 RepID=A0A6A6HLY6_VIRVR|nr:hypothetical protein EV356DRAFT_165233 [Viridothelium virens]